MQTLDVYNLSKLLIRAIWSRPCHRLYKTISQIIIQDKANAIATWAWLTSNGGLQVITFWALVSSLHSTLPKSSSTFIQLKLILDDPCQ